MPLGRAPALRVLRAMRFGRPNLPYTWPDYQPGHTAVSEETAQLVFRYNVGGFKFSSEIMRCR